MKCVNCLIQVSGQKIAESPNLKTCASCGHQMVPTVKDVLLYNCYGLVKETRAEQIRMAQDITEVLENKKSCLLAEGGTGLGKSYAYIIPILTRILESQNRPADKDTEDTSEPKRVVIATAKKSLQDQLFRDVPMLCQALGIKNPSVVLYKGQTNYACWKAVDNVPDTDKNMFTKLVSEAQAAGQPFDVNQWPGGTPSWWSRVHLDNCNIKDQCEHYRSCHPKAKDAQIVITNHHLVALDLTLMTPGWLLGTYDTLIVDEAHHFPEALRSQLTQTLNPEVLQKAADRLANDQHLVAEFEEIANGIVMVPDQAQHLRTAHDAIIKLMDKVRNTANSTKKYDSTPFREEFYECYGLTDDCHVYLIPPQNELEASYLALKSGGGGTDQRGFTPEFYLAMSNRVTKVINTVSKAATFLQRHSSGEDFEKYVTTVTDKELQCMPLEIGPIVGAALNNIPHKIFVSATLSLKDDFTYFQNELGLAEDDLTTSVYKSPYDTTNNVALYLPHWDTPVPAHDNSVNRQQWLTAISDSILKLCKITSGGAFVLFSATKDMRDIAEILNTQFQEANLKLIIQEGDITQQVAYFREINNGVLFGLKSLWEGIDIAGDTLRCVIIPKLPFPNPNDSLIAALTEKIEAEGQNAFQKISLPKMYQDMRQGVGRLIRSAEDRGIVAILDPRVWTGSSKDHSSKIARIKKDPNHTRLGYGKELLDILGFTTITNDYKQLSRWFDKRFKKMNS